MKCEIMCKADQSVKMYQHAKMYDYILVNKLYRGSIIRSKG